MSKTANDHNSVSILWNLHKRLTDYLHSIPKQYTNIMAQAKNGLRDIWLTRVQSKELPALQRAVTLLKSYGFAHNFNVKIAKTGKGHNSKFYRICPEVNQFTPHPQPIYKISNPTSNSFRDILLTMWKCQKVAKGRKSSKVHGNCSQGDQVIFFSAPTITANNMALAQTVFEISC